MKRHPRTRALRKKALFRNGHGFHGVRSNKAIRRKARQDLRQALE